MLSEFSPACVALQETMLGDSTYSSPPGYRAFFNTPFPDQGHHGGTAILVRQDIPVVPLQLNSPLQVVAVNVFMGRSYTICNLYLPPRLPVSRGELDGLLRQLIPPFLLLGDFNGRHPLWDEGASNPSNFNRFFY